MSITVEVTYDMSKALGTNRFEVEGAKSVEDVLRLTRDKFGQQPDDFEKLTRVASIAINGVLVSYRRGVRSPVADGDTVTFLKPAAGG
jgi:molybdopterin converting factor small subunit